MAFQTIDSKAFAKLLKTVPAGGFLLYGDEDYLKDRCVEAAHNTVVPDDSLALFNEIKLDGTNFTADDLAKALDPMPMMADVKLILVRGLRPSDWKKDDWDSLVSVISTIPSYSQNLVLITCPSDVLFDSTPKKPNAILSELSQWITPVLFDKATPQQLQSWIERHFSSDGITADSSVSQLLIQRCGDGMYTLSYEIDKLSWYLLSQGRNTVTKEDILNITVQDMSFGTFDLSNALLGQRKADALRILFNMKFNKVDPIFVLTQISSLFCDQLEIRNLMDEGKSKSSIASILHMNEYRVGIYMQGIGSVPTARIRSIVRQCAKADAMMKRGKSDYDAIEFLICST